MWLYPSVKKFEDIITRLIQYRNFTDSKTDSQPDRQTPHDGIKYLSSPNH